MTGKPRSSEQHGPIPTRERFSPWHDLAARSLMPIGDRGEYNAVNAAYAMYPYTPQVEASVGALGIRAEQEAVSTLNTNLGRGAAGGLMPEGVSLEQANADITAGLTQLLQQEADQEQLAVQAAEAITMEAAREPQVPQAQMLDPDAAQRAEAARASLAQIHGTPMGPEEARV